jgi:branched-chain amino acid transport system permease protein/neutral amino acid transport system permease protein
MLLESAGFGLVTGAIIALAAMGLSLQIGVTNVPNFAHGEFLTYGAYGALIAQFLTKNLVVDALAAMLLGAAIAYLMNRIVLQSFIKIRTRPIYLLIVTAGLSIVLQNVLQLAFGVTPRNLSLPGGASVPYHVGPFIWTRADITIMSGAVVVILLMFGILQFTRFGKAQRAVSDSPELARVSGIPVRQVVNLTWVIVGATTGLAGLAIASTSGTLTPTMGYQFLLVVFAAAVLGGIGKPYGALAAGLIVGLAMEISSAYTNAAYNEIIAVGILVVAIMFRPRGLFASSREAW